MFKSVTNQSGNKVKINLDNVTWVEQVEEAVVVHFVGGESLFLDKDKNEDLMSFF